MKIEVDLLIDWLIDWPLIHRLIDKNIYIYLTKASLLIGYSRD